MLNVYAPQGIVAKRVLWDEVKSLKASKPGIWIVLGDFNTVRSHEERRNSNFSQLCANDFNNFIHTADLSEYNLKGRKFTYASKNGHKLSRIDRILTCHELSRIDRILTCHKPRFKSDRAPLILTTTSQDFGPIPFRLFNSLML